MILEHVNHPFLVGLAYAFQTSNKLYFIMNFMSKNYFMQREDNYFNICQMQKNFHKSRQSFMQCKYHLHWAIFIQKILFIET